MQKRIVITGSTKGIGLGLATYFLEKGHQVVISGTSEKSVHEATERLLEKSLVPVNAVVCNVKNYPEVLNLCNIAAESMGGIDIWINNAGVTQAHCPSYLLPHDEIQRIVDINLHGVINGSKIAINYMLKQGHGAVYNMEGLGSDGRIAKNLGYYGMTKSALRYITKIYASEMEGNSVIVGRLSPGMVTTQLLLKDLEKMENAEKVRKIFSILADPVSKVAPYLGDRILKNTKNNQLLAWLTTPKIIFRFMTAGIIHRDPFQNN